ncbi:hypothetical protein CQW23_25264 [Capsicum baccatum]|uniref:SMP-30/Gluconolactonase/LRE-like region domain-containing protein n=1 Tax=Capsicum baccatum TaxID=33114 RepID=A0A2G2VKG1_CAPBA|nr:hypothetical protein CQW23_25264 [Capsicum baccatum]
MNFSLFSTLFLFITTISIPTVAGTKPHVINFRSPNLYPKSFTWDPKSQHFIVGGSTRHHHQNLISVSDAGVVHTLITDATLPPNSSFHGLTIDRQNNRLLASIHCPPSPPEFPAPLNFLASYNLQSNRRLFLTSLSDESHLLAVANDVAVDYYGNAYVTNSGADVIWKVDINGDVSILSHSKAFTAAKRGLNGIVHSSRGYLFVGQSSTGKLFKVDVDDGTARAVTLNKDLTAADGIAVRDDGVLLVVSKRTLYFLRSNDGWGAGAVFDEIALDTRRFATAVTVGDQKRAYVLYGHVTEGINGNAERDEFSIVEVKSNEENEEESIWLYVFIGLGLTIFFFWRFQMHRLVERLNKKTV